MKGYVYCKDCGKKIGLLDEVEYSQMKAEGTLPDLCDPCIAKKIDLDLEAVDLFGFSEL